MTAPVRCASTTSTRLPLRRGTRHSFYVTEANVPLFNRLLLGTPFSDARRHYGIY
jgi:hypothetical protein